MNIVNVQGTGFRPYEVIIGQGLIKDAGKYISPFLNYPRCVIVTDSHVAKLHLDTLKSALETAVIKVDVIIVEAGEASKSWEGLRYVTDGLLRLELDRKDVVIALGGGVIGDLCGLACALYMRGIDFIQIPTTLLAQVDSSVGGKTAIDHESGKNLIGAFHQPRLVLCDLDVLHTLDRRQVLAGYAEVIKYGLLGDKAFFEWLEAHHQGVTSLNPHHLTHAISRSVQMKAEIVSADEREGGKRALLNLGHTFGHALEAECGFGDTLLHGEAVAIGMAMAFRYSAKMGYCRHDEAIRAQAAIAKSGLPTQMSQINWPSFFADKLICHMSHDKKAEGGALSLVLAHSIGDCYVAKQVTSSCVFDFLLDEGAIPRPSQDEVIATC